MIFQLRHRLILEALEDFYPYGVTPDQLAQEFKRRWNLVAVGDRPHSRTPSPHSRGGAVRTLLHLGLIDVSDYDRRRYFLDSRTYYARKSKSCR